MFLCMYASICLCIYVSIYLSIHIDILREVGLGVYSRARCAQALTSVRRYAACLRVKGGFRIWGLEIRDEGSGFRV